MLTTDPSGFGSLWDDETFNKAGSRLSGVVLLEVSLVITREYIEKTGRDRIIEGL
jgi:hypothetical protein